VHNKVYNTLMHHIVNTYKKKSSHVVVWLVRVGTATSGRAVELVWLRVIGAGCMKNLHQLKNNMKMKKLKDSNDKKRTGAPRGDPK
jgi:hypothetical protein